MNLLKNIKKKLKQNKHLELLSRMAFSWAPVYLRESMSRSSGYAYSSIEDDYNIIFVHIPKCAGNAIMQSLFGVRGQGHHKIIDYLKEDKEKFYNYFKFAVIRDPIERFVSAFYYLKRGGMGTYDREFSDKYLSGFQSVDQLCKAMMEDKSLEVRVLKWTHFIPQVEYVFLNGECALDFAIPFDQIHNGYHILKNKLKVIGKESLLTVNATNNENKSGPNEISRAYLDSIYKTDIEFYSSLRGIDENSFND